MATESPAYEIDTQDVEYLHHDGKPLLARLYRPRGKGPFPAIVEAHGGAWCLGDRLSDAPLNEALARNGIVVAALDFRVPPAAGYPASLADINYGVRWFKTHAEEYGSDPSQVGIMGSSSGGHQAMLAAMRPHDPRYSALPLPIEGVADGGVRFAVLLWPVIDPLGRYRYAKQLKASGAPYPKFVDLVLPLHDKYWSSEAAMEEGNPALALVRHERVQLPPVLYIQGADDIVHPRKDLDRFVMNYHEAGGYLDLALFEDAAEGFIIRKPGSQAAADAIAKITAFVRTHTP
ncbi:MAG: alpha/beta hydrolase [Candidatus Binataceae bacterium]|jgi:acetyl esterase/lipase